MPAVSIIIPSCNHARYLEQRIESVLSQTFTDFELIILDDASSDNSVEIIKRFTRIDKRMSFHPSNSNSGSPFVQWNKGVRLAKADLIWIAESDDVAALDFLKVMVEQHNVNPAIALAFCQSNRMSDKGIISGTWKTFTDDLKSDRFGGDFIMKGIDFIRYFLIHKNVVPNASAVVFKKSVYNEVGGANEKLTTNSDWLTWLKMLLKSDLAFTSKPLNNFRYHSKSVIGRLANSENKNYKEQYDLTMRNEFEKYCKAASVTLPESIADENKKYRSFDYGNKGIYQWTKGEALDGFINLVRASLSPKPTFGYFRRLMKGEKQF
ncbi:glycosyltransferase family 2 protein [Segetibacter aerophilus]|uniref:Glycosyltransferase 2-like domain-containing protein n=1 Tax=Segetibacter aerophilus TaxID=670293 RepID=A0A512B6M5_9BACT|nr:glycosyltransferase [Segetibacter aerophilus]GEO07615.1 hypothetical protein SAE01_01110 [Segetibacter aerophilus]